MFDQLDRPDRSFAVFVLGYSALATALFYSRVQEPGEAAYFGFFAALFTTAAYLPAVLAGGLAVWTIDPPRPLRIPIYCVFLVLIPAHLYVYSRGSLLSVHVPGWSLNGLLDYVVQMCLLAAAFLAVAWTATFVNRKRNQE